MESHAHTHEDQGAGGEKIHSTHYIQHGEIDKGGGRKLGKSVSKSRKNQRNKVISLLQNTESMSTQQTKVGRMNSILCVFFW